MEKGDMENKILPKSKRSLSTVIASLIMVLLVVVAVGIVSQIIFPMIKKDLSSAGNCLSAIGNVQFNGEYTCYNANTKKISASIETKKILVDGFVVNIFGGGKAESYKIQSGNVEKVIMSDGNLNIIIPKENEARVYEVTTGIANPETIVVSPIVKGETCEEADKMILNKCK